MKRTMIHLIYGVVFVLAFGILSVQSPADLIEPTRTLKSDAEETGRLRVLSEPPGLEARLDGDPIGKTPTDLSTVEAGIHKLRVQDAETEIYVEPGKTLQISLFKGEFITIPVEEKPEPDQAESSRQMEAKQPSTPEPAKKEAEGGPPPLDPIERYQLLRIY